MSIPKSPSAYDDCFALLDKAINSEKGIRVWRSSYESARYLTNRMNYARALQRKINEEAFEKTDMRHYGTKYDGLSIRNPKEADDKGWWIYIEPSKEIDDSEVEEL